jgi:hypothetical protein
MRFLTSLLLILIVFSASAETYCEQTQRYHNGIEVWDRKCGPNPDANIKVAAREDCLETVKLLRNNPGSSWNSNMGWMYEDQCERLDKGLD